MPENPARFIPINSGTIINAQTTGSEIMTPIFLWNRIATRGCFMYAREKKTYLSFRLIGTFNGGNVDEKVRNILRMMLRLKMIAPKSGERRQGAYNTPEHREAPGKGAEGFCQSIPGTRGDKADRYGTARKRFCFL